MECAKQGYWMIEHKDKKYGGKSAFYEKCQYHKARRRHDEQLIEEQLRDRFASDNVVGWPTFDVDPTPLFCYREHNHKVKLREVA